MSRKPKRPLRLFNRSTIGFAVMFLAAAGMLYRMFQPYWRAPPERSRPARTTPVAKDAPLVPVVRVVDGDTIQVRYKGKKESVRLLAINTPEHGRSGYVEATEALRRLVDDKRVRLVFEEPGLERRDKYGRLLAYVEADGVNANVEMVEKGWTRFWTKYGQGRLASMFRAAEQRARREERGLWTDRGWNL